MDKSTLLPLLDIGYPSWHYGLMVRHLPIKRAFDLVFSFLAFLLGWPLFLFIALIVRLTSKGKVIYSQERIGRGGRPFKCYKFRTMYPDAEARLEELLNRDCHLKNEWILRRKLNRDPRVTPLGRFLRRTCLDEIPQFWNVVKGDLSIVGPRPVPREELNEYYGAKAAKILQLRPGLTGIWQTSRQESTSYSQRVAMDEEYIDTHHLLLDLKLVLKTIRMIFRFR